MALILAGVVAVGTLAWCALMVMANGMSDAPSQAGLSIWPWFIGGMVIAGLLAGSHWLHLSW